MTTQSDGGAGREASIPDQGLPGVPLTDEDVVDAMRHIEGYLDITTEDFRQVYALAHRHAVDRLLGGLCADRLMRTGVAVLAPAMMLDEAARVLAGSGYKALPVADGDGRVVGILTESDFLRCLRADSFLELMLRSIEHPGETGHRCHGTTVREAMSAPAVTVAPNAGLREMLAAFRRHGGRSMPVTGEDGRLLGMLLRKNFLEALDAGARR